MITDVDLLTLTSEATLHQIAKRIKTEFVKRAVFWVDDTVCFQSPDKD
ncbi:MAG: hypothetical protein U5K35_12870 [Rhodohalobacter sp.]|nr:hypothetical protein [Rhodohalobacter sp.]